MILEIQQFIVDRTSAYRCYRNKETICDVIVPYEPTQRIFYFNFMNKNRRIELRFTPRDKSRGKDVVSRYSKHIYCNGEYQGYIASTKEYGLFDVEYLNKMYKVYNIDNSNVCCQVVKNEMGQLVAEIERYKKPYKQLDHYTAYTEDDELEELLCMLAVNIDFMEYTEVYGGEKVITNGYRNTTGMPIFDKEFIENIAIRENFDITKEPDTPVDPVDWKFSDEGVNKSTARVSIQNNIMWFVVFVFIVFLLKILF